MCFPEFRFDSRRSVFGAFALSITLAVGCGGKGTVSGTVTLDGTPLPAGTIAIIPSNGPGGVGPIQDGKYSLTKISTGKATITVETDSIKKQLDSLAAAPSQSMQRSAGGRMTPEMLAKMPENAKQQMEERQKQMEGAGQKAQELKAKYRPLPEKYSESKSSGLTFEVKSGDNTFNVELSSK